MMARTGQPQTHHLGTITFETHVEQISFSCFLTSVSPIWDNTRFKMVTPVNQIPLRPDIQNAPEYREWK